MNSARIKWWAVWLIAMAPMSVYSDAFLEAASAMCEKSKQCAKASLAGEAMAPEMEAMLMQHIDQLCMTMQGQFSRMASASGHPLYQPATACMRSLAEQSCAELEASDNSTPACARYEAQAADYD